MFFVRSAMPGDLPAIRDLLRTTWHATYDPLYGADKVATLSAKWHSDAALAADLARPASEFLVADDGSRIGGTAYASVTEKNTVTLHRLCVLPELQRQGIGRDLFAEIETCFDGATRLKVSVEVANADAIAFYEDHGMVATGEAEANADGILVRIMEKPLG